MKKSLLTLVKSALVAAIISTIPVQSHAMKGLQKKAACYQDRQRFDREQQMELLIRQLNLENPLVYTAYNNRNVTREQSAILVQNLNNFKMYFAANFPQEGIYSMLECKLLQYVDRNAELTERILTQEEYYSAYQAFLKKEYSKELLHKISHLAISTVIGATTYGVYYYSQNRALSASYLAMASFSYLSPKISSFVSANLAKLYSYRPEVIENNILTPIRNLINQYSPINL